MKFKGMELRDGYYVDVFECGDNYRANIYTTRELRFTLLAKTEAGAMAEVVRWINAERGKQVARACERGRYG